MPKLRPTHFMILENLPIAKVILAQTHLTESPSEGLGGHIFAPTVNTGFPNLNSHFHTTVIHTYTNAAQSLSRLIHTRHAVLYEVRNIGSSKPAEPPTPSGSLPYCLRRCSTSYRLALRWCARVLSSVVAENTNQTLTAAARGVATQDNAHCDASPTTCPESRHLREQFPPNLTCWNS